MESEGISFNKMERNLLRIRHKVFPKSPKTCDAVTDAFARESIYEVFGTSKHNDARPFYKTTVKTDSYGFVIFASDTTIDLIRGNIAVDRRNIIMDATFKITPLGDFNQFLIIYIEYMEKVTL